MSYTTISRLEDFDFIFNVDIYLSNLPGVEIDEEIYHNMWEIMFDDSFIQTIGLLELQLFFKKLIKNRSKKVFDGSYYSGATLYLWFDEQALQLRFNILSGIDIELPFGCTVNIVKTPEIILEKFLEDAQISAEKGGHLLFEEMKILEPGDEGFGEMDEYDLDPKAWVQDVYKVSLPLIEEE